MDFGENRVYPTADAMYMFFGKHDFLSQWHPAIFELDGIIYSCAEQYYMHQKALLFNDSQSAKKILEASDPWTHKRLGRLVQGFDFKVWQKHCHRVVYQANYAKFAQNGQLKSQLLATKGKLLVETSPYDCIWGIGLGKSDPRASQQSKWRGTNWLGYVLTELREHLLREDGQQSSYNITWNHMTLLSGNAIVYLPMK